MKTSGDILAWAGLVILFAFPTPGCGGVDVEPDGTYSAYDGDGGSDEGGGWGDSDGGSDEGGGGGDSDGDSDEGGGWGDSDGDSDEGGGPAETI